VSNGVEHPAGFIFHASRCGSTLVSQMFGAVESNLVISESPLIDFVLRSQVNETVIGDEQRALWLRWVIGVLGRTRGKASRTFVKFDSWHVMHLPLVRRAFPKVPWIFIYRDPLEILVSHHQQPGSQMVPGTLDPRPLGIHPAELHQMPLEEYGARVLAAVLETAAIHTQTHDGILINYTQLPEAACSFIPRVFGVECSSNDVERMRNAARFHAKNPSLDFEPDGEKKREEAGENLTELAKKWLWTPYERLEALRRKQSHA